jgi:hypothetical protein
MAETKAIEIKGLGIYGVIRQAEVSDDLIPDGAVVEAVNVNFDRKGAVQLRPGITNLGGTVQVGGACYGIFNAVFSTSSTYRPLVAMTEGGSQSIYLYQSGSWSVSLDGDTQSLKTRFTTFNDFVFRVNGTDNMRVWSGGGTWIATGGQMNPDDMASYDTKYIENFKSRVYVAGDLSYPYRLYYSSVISSTGLIDWTPTTDYVDIVDGEEITALKRYATELLVFKPNYIYRFNTSGVDPDPMIKVGTRSQESIVEGKNGIYFHHYTGFWKYSGSMPTEISRAISDLIPLISTQTDIFGWKDSDHIYWSVGDLTVEGESWPDVTLRYTESSDLWTVYSYGKTMRMGTDYYNGSTVTQIIGSDNGHVYTLNSGNSDDGTAIGYWFITKWLEFGNSGVKKVIKDIDCYYDKALKAKILYQIDDEDSWKELGQVIRDYDQLNIKFYRIRFKIRGISSEEAWIFRKLAITDYTTTDL